MGFGFSVGHIVEYHLVFLHCAFVEHFGGDVFGRDVYAFAFCFVHDLREQAHFKLEGEDIGAADVIFSAFHEFCMKA